MEKTFKLKTSDGHTIYGVINTTDKKSNLLAVFVHGLTGHPNEHFFYNAAQQFPKKGVDVVRFSLYADGKDSRKLSECDVTTHSKDLDTVVRHFRNKYKNIAVIGHSLGSPTILKSDISKVDVIVLWDPSCLWGKKAEGLKQVSINNQATYVTDWGTETILNKNIVKEWEWFDAENELSLIAGLGKPLKVIAAGKGILVNGSKKYIKVAQKPKELTIIAGATHCFDEEGKEKILLDETILWIKRHSK